MALGLVKRPKMGGKLLKEEEKRGVKGLRFNLIIRLKKRVLSKKNKLKKKDLNKILRKGKRFNGEILLLIIFKNDLKNTRVGLIISKKVSKKAVVRNKIKRRIYSLIRNKLSKIKTGFDVLIITRPEIKEKNFFEINKILSKVLKRAGVIKNKENDKKYNS